MTAQNILIVEDDQAIREMLAALLREEGYTILVAPDGKPRWNACARMQRGWSYCWI